MGIVVRKVSQFEKHQTWTAYHKAVVSKLIFISTLNSVSVLLLVNLLTFKYVSFATHGQSIPGISDSDHYAFYESYGIINDLTSLLVTSAIASPLSDFLSPIYLAKLCKRRGILKKAKNGLIGMTQGKLNMVWQNPDIDMAQKYANFMKTFLICIIFAPIFPLGVIIGFFSMIIQY